MTNDLRGKVALITGGTRGIGRATAEALAERGATVVIVGRNQQAGDGALQSLRVKGTMADFIPADLSLMADVRRVAETFRRAHPRLDILVHSADVLLSKRQTTAEGLEVSFATNYLSRFLLNNLLADLLVASAPARVIHVAAAGFPGALKLDHLPPPPELSSFAGHNVGQRANDVFGVEWAARLVGTGVTINIMNPGMVDTDIRRRAPSGKLLMRAVELLLKPVTKTPARFAQRVLALATVPEYAGVSGRLWGANGKRLPIRPAVSDPHTRKQLWAISERLTGLVADQRPNASLKLVHAGGV